MPVRANPGIAQVWAEYAKTKSEKSRNLLMEHYHPVVVDIARRIHAKLPRQVEVDDLVSAGTFGLMYAIAGFDPGRKVKFETYCGSRIRGAILDELRAWDWVPRLARRRAARYVAATEQLEVELGRRPSTDELTRRMKCPAAEMKKVVRDARLVKVLPLARMPLGPQDESERQVDILPQPESPERFMPAEYEDVRRLVKEDLSRAEQLIVVLYYGEQMTMKEIGQTLDLSESRVSQLHSGILDRLRRRLRVEPALAA